MNLKEIIKDLEKFESLSKLPISIEMYQEGYKVLKNQIKNDIQDNYDSICGAKIIIKDNIKGLEKNQCKINYSDWSYKIITIC